MDIDLRSDFPLTDEACHAATGKTFVEWSALLDAQTALTGKRRESINWLWDQVGRSPVNAWWGTTIYVEHERRHGKVQKDGRPEGYNICVTKSVKAPVDQVLAAIAESIASKDIQRIREGKDVRASWQTAGHAPTEIEATVKDTAGKVAIAVMHKRIDTREEADGLRRAWQARLDAIKTQLEA